MSQSNSDTVVLHCICNWYNGLMQIAHFIMHLPESPTVISLFIWLDFEPPPFFADMAFLQQKMTKMNKKIPGLRGKLENAHGGEVLECQRSKRIASNDLASNLPLEMVSHR